MNNVIIIPVKENNTYINITLNMINISSKKVDEVILVIDEQLTENDQLFLIKDDFNFSLKIITGETNCVGDAIRLGIKKSKAEFIGIIPVDEIIIPFYIDDFFLALATSNINFVSATRYSNSGKRYGGVSVGKNYSRLFNLFFRILSKNQVTDLTTGVKFWNSSLTDLILDPDIKSWAIMTRLAQNFFRKFGYNGYMELPVVSIDKIFGGTSSLTYKKLTLWVIDYLRATFRISNDK